MFSFCQNKVISTGEGGVIVTNSKEIYEKAKLLRSHGRVELATDYFSSIGDNDYIEIGYNFRMPTMSAALGISQLKKIEKLTSMRKEIAHYYSKNLSKIKGVIVPKELPGHYSVFQMYTIQLENEKDRDKLQDHLSEKGIMSKVYFNPVHLKTIFTKNYGCKEGDLPLTETLSKKVLNIPLYAKMTKEEADHIINSIKEFFENEGHK